MSAFPEHEGNQSSGVDSWQAKIAELLDDITVPAYRARPASLELGQTAPGRRVSPAEPSGNGAVHGQQDAAAPTVGRPIEEPAGHAGLTGPDGSHPSAEEEPIPAAHQATEPQPGAQAHSVEETRHAGEPPSHDEQAMSMVKIRGRSDGVFIEIGHGSWPAVLAALGQRLGPSAQFFRGGQVALDVGARPLVEPELHDLHGLLLRYGLTLRQIHTESRRTFESALALGLAATLVKATEEESVVAQPVESNVDGTGYFVYSGSVRSGQVVRRTESILLIGDVNPGGHIISSGHILVWGRLRGIAHAGAEGNTKAVVAALDLDATQLRIGNYVASRPAQPDQERNWFWQKSTAKRPEVAHLDRDVQKVVIDPWDESKMATLSVLRQ